MNEPSVTNRINVVSGELPDKDRQVLKARFGNPKVRAEDERCPKCDGWGRVVWWSMSPPVSSTANFSSHYLLGCNLCSTTGMKEIAVLNTLGGR